MNKKDELHVRIDEDDKGRLEWLIEATGKPKSDIVRDAITLLYYQQKRFIEKKN